MVTVCFHIYVTLQFKSSLKSFDLKNLYRSPGGNGNLLQYSCLENSMYRGAWHVHPCTWGGKESDRTETVIQSLLYVYTSKYIYGEFGHLT